MDSKKKGTHFKTEKVGMSQDLCTQKTTYRERRSADTKNKGAVSEEKLSVSSQNIDESNNPKFFQSILDDDETVFRSISDDDETIRPGAIAEPGILSNTIRLDSHDSLFPSWREDPQHLSKPKILTTAVLVTEEGLVETEIKEKAHADIKAKFLDNAVKAEEIKIVPGPRKSDAIHKQRKLFTLAGIVLLAIVVIVIATLVSFSSLAPAKQTLSPTNAPTSSPTIRPQVFFERSCQKAIDITNRIGSSFFGEIPNDATVALVDTCEIIRENGRGVWYKFEGNGSRLALSTCEDTNFDTQISVFEGSCKGDDVSLLQCLGGNDQMGSCDDQSRLAVATKAGVMYHVYVHGRRSATGLFKLTIDVMGNNDQCDNAIHLGSRQIEEGFETATSTVIFGSTRGAEEGSFGQWYTVPGGGDRLTMSLNDGGETSFSGEIAVFEGSNCEQLRIIDAGSWISVVSDVNQEYNIVVYGDGEDSMQGDFELTLQYGDIALPIERIPPFNEIVFPGESIFGSTRFQQIYSVESCGDKVFSTSSGVWTSVIGTGEVLNLSTCSEGASLDTQISVFRGSLENMDGLVCIDGNDQGCGDQSVVSWFSEPDVIYSILVHGFGDRTGDFVLSFNQEPPAYIAPVCNEAIDVELDGTSTLGDLGTVLVAGEEISPPSCSSFSTGTINNRGTTGAWYRVKGTGDSITASMCSQTYSTSVSLSVYAGSCDDDASSKGSGLACVEGESIPCGPQESFVWFAEEGVEYYVWIHGSSTENVTSALAGAFGVSVEKTPPNNMCRSAIGPLSGDGSLTFGSTRGASLDSGVAEGRDVSRGIWYTVVGTGDDMFLSTCFYHTNFATSLTVFSGSCDVLTVEAESTRDGRGCDGSKGVGLGWSSVEGDVYYILVSGESVDDLGSFALSLI